MKGGHIHKNKEPFRPIVIGAPRSGFSLLINIVSRLYPLTTGNHSIERRMIKAFINSAGPEIANSISRVMSQAGLESDLIYNDNFRLAVGGPYWIDENEHDRICFRKYIGVRGMGDFTLLTSHPRGISDFYEIVHSHIHPETWLSHPAYLDCIKLSSIRHPADILASSCFSINALASEYIQRFVPPEDDNDLLRQGLALYKLSDINFFEGLIAPLKSYLEEFLHCQNQFGYVMRWEDLIKNPIDTIMAVGAACEVTLDSDIAGMIWKDMGYRNLTGAHKHNFRAGHGRVGGWRYSLTNSHIECMKDNGLEPYCIKMGYGELPQLKKMEYTCFQNKVNSFIQSGSAYNEFPDRDLFKFAFNKSNLDFSSFPSFKTYSWRDHTRIERSSFKDEELLMRVWDAAEDSVNRFNSAYKELIELDYLMENEVIPMWKSALKRWKLPVRNVMLSMEKELDAEACSTYQDPVLFQSIGTVNIVSFAGRFYGLPQSLGPIDLRSQTVDNLPDVIVTDSLAEIIAILSRNTI